MEIKVIEEKKNRLTFELPGKTHTFCNILKEELLNDKHVKISSYAVEHPLISSPRMIVETDGDETPKASLAAACQRLKKTNDKVRKDFQKEAK